MLTGTKRGQIVTKRNSFNYNEKNIFKISCNLAILFVRECIQPNSLRHKTDFALIQLFECDNG